MHGFEVQKYATRISEINYSAFNRLVLGSSPRHPKSSFAISFSCWIFATQSRGWNRESTGRQSGPLGGASPLKPRVSKGPVPKGRGWLVVYKKVSPQNNGCFYN
jgi:hypothetical protein